VISQRVCFFTLPKSEYHKKSKMAVFWRDEPCSLVEIYRRFRGAYCLHHQGDEYRSKHLWNVGQFLLDNTAHHARIQPSSYSPPWESESYVVLFGERPNLIPIIWVERKVFAFSKRWRKQKLYCHLFKSFWCLSCHYINYGSNGNYIID
jgi:hypothetical protein